ncbi:MAG: TonB-dependent receptor [Flavobacteriales bacterium]|nr:MAG: TonB-dependent receptor [Flavobacteriales bacterium]
MVQLVAFFRRVFLVFSLLVSSVVCAQSLVVVDERSLQPLEGVLLFHTGTGTVVYTDARGRGALSPFLSLDSIQISQLGYHTSRHSVRQLVEFTAQVALVPKAFTLGEFVVSVHRWEQEGDRLAEHITVIRRRDIAHLNPGTSADILEQSGEVFVQRSQLGGGSPMLRGFAANRVLIVVDGVRMNNAIYRSGNLQNVISLDPEAVERAEVLHGPGGMTYGSDAIGGVMDFHLLRPRFASDTTLLLHGGATARFASAADALTGHLHLGLGSKKLAFIGSVSLYRFGDLRTGSHGPKDYLRPWYVGNVYGRDSVLVNNDQRLQRDSGYDARMAFAKLAYRPSLHVELGINAYQSGTSDIPRYDRLIEVRPNGQPRSAVWYYGPQVWRMVSAYVRHEAVSGAWSKAHLSIAHQDYSESRVDRSYRSSSERDQRDRVTGIWGNLDLEKDLSGRTQLQYGAEYITNLVRSIGTNRDLNTGLEGNFNSRYPDGSTWNTRSIYAGTLHDITERLTLSVGIRGSSTALSCSFDTTLFSYPATAANLRNNALTGNLGLAYRPDSTWKISLDMSTGFRAPNVDDIGKVFDSEPGAVIVPNPGLVPEYAYSGEIGIGKVFGDRARLRGVAFMVLLDQAMVRRPFTLNGQDSILYGGESSRVDAIVNAAQATVHGVNVTADVLLTEDLRLDVHYNWQRGVEQDDLTTVNVPLRHAPPPFGRAGITWERKAWRISTSFRFSDGFTYEELPPTEQGKPALYARDPQGRPHAPAWYTIDTMATYRITASIQVNAGLENIADHRYRPYSSGISAPGRNVMVALRATF